MISKTDFRDWKSNPVTKQVYATIGIRIQGLQEELGYTAGQDVRQDGMKVGAIQAYRDFLEMTHDEGDSE